MKAQQFDFKGFTGVEIKGAFEFEVSRSESFGVSVGQSWFKHTQVYLRDGRLIVYHPWYDVTSWFTPWIRPFVSVRMPALSELRVLGACDGSVVGFKSTDALRVTVQGASTLSGDLVGGTSELEVAGASKTRLSLTATSLKLRLLGASRLNGSLKADKGDIEVAGASRLGLTGNVIDARFNVAGASRLDLRDFAVQNANVRLVGASRCELRVDGKLDAELAGASRLVYDGNPVMGRVSTIGASSLSRR
jgi:hypothetical protein